MAKAPVTPTRETLFVIARNGANLRRTPDTSLPEKRRLPVGTKLHILSHVNGWVKVDLEGDELADGFVFAELTGPVAPIAAAVENEDAHVAPPRPDILGRLTPTMVRKMFVPATRLPNIAANLPHVVAGLRRFGLGDRAMALMALSSIRAESEGFLPISEGISKFNTQVRPFDLYEPGRSAGDRVGNTKAGDGARFKGRGFVQLTGRFNYADVGGRIGVDLSGDPERANDGPTAGLILACFLAKRESGIRQALAQRDLAKARKLVNGGAHGLDRFVDAFTEGERLL